MELSLELFVKSIILGGLLIAGRFLIAAIVKDVAQKISFQLIFIRFFSKFLKFIPPHPIWSHWGTICWTVESDNFQAENCSVAQVYRVFNTVGLEAMVKSADGKSVPYRFIGKLSRENTILTGEWFDSRGKVGNYHGTFQLRSFNAQSKAIGKWIGFSESTNEIKVGEMTWEKYLNNQNLTTATLNENVF